MGFLQPGAINYLAILVAAVAGWVIGMAWYMALGRKWAAANNIVIDPAVSRRPPTGLLVLTFIAQLVMAWVLSGILFHLGPGKLNVRNGVISGAWMWLGFVITAMAVNYSFAQRRPVLIAIDGGHWLVVLLAMGAILGALG